MFEQNLLLAAVSAISGAISTVFITKIKSKINKYRQILKNCNLPTPCY